MAALATVADYFNAARILLQDTVVPYRTPDTDLALALNLAFIDAKRLRPDLFIDVDLPNYTASSSTAVPVDEQYRSAFLSYVVGWAQLKDDEASTDARAGEFLKRFAVHLTALG